MSNDRHYKLKVRADRQLQTQHRIVTATEALHREVGPARTTIADIARRAGVERQTVYNHFPELAELLAACQANFLRGHPPPDVSPSVDANRNAIDSLELALVQLYRWFRANEAIEANIHRDRQLMPELDRLLRQSVDPVMDRAASAYSALIARSPRAAAPVRSLVRVALEFRTWQVATRGGLSDREAARLLARAVAAVS